MNCSESRVLIDADADGELDLVRHLELEAHMRACPACASAADAARARRAALRGALPRFTAPPQLVERIRASLGAGKSQPARRALVLWPVWNAAGVAASLALAVFGGYAWGRALARGDALFSEAAAGHVRSMQASHLLDVVSTDQHTVKPWFIGKLDFSPPVADLSDMGFPLTGGRLEHLDGRSAAALVFKRRQHVINLFIWPAGDSGVSTRREHKNGYNLSAWSHGGLNFMAVSEIPRDELDQFIAGFRGRTE